MKGSTVSLFWWICHNHLLLPNNSSSKEQILQATPWLKAKTSSDIRTCQEEPSPHIGWTFSAFKKKQTVQVLKFPHLSGLQLEEQVPTSCRLDLPFVGPSFIRSRSLTELEGGQHRPTAHGVTVRFGWRKAPERTNHKEREVMGSRWKAAAWHGQLKATCIILHQFAQDQSSARPSERSNNIGFWHWKNNRVDKNVQQTVVSGPDINWQQPFWTAFPMSKCETR